MGIKLSEISTRAPKDFDKEKTKALLPTITEKLDALQNLLFAEAKHSVLVIIQGLDASGKDGAINNVFTYVNPMGVQVKSFKAPTPEELAHDFLWRVHQHSPAKGMIQIFNRSHYEDILITRVHQWIDDDTAKQRMDAINHYEKLLTTHNNTTILKFYLHVSQKEQQERLQERMSDPTKQWKYNANDFKEAEKWDDYMKVYEDCFDNCNHIPWTIVPADQNWYKEYIIASVVVETLEKLNMKFPGMKKEV